MKRYLTLLLCLLLLLSLAGCSAETATTEPSTTASTAATKVPGMTDFPENASTGLAYAVNEDGETCTVTGLGKCKDVYVKIPAEIDDYKVTAIGDNAFYNQKKLEGIYFASSIVHVGKYAFFGCEGLTQLILSDHLETIGEYAFACCRALEQVEIPGSVHSIDGWAFYGCTGLQGVFISDMDQWLRITFGGIYANPLICAKTLYLNEVPVKKVEIPADMTVLSAWVFAGCTSIEQLQLHAGVTVFEERALMDCENMTKIVFAGTMEQWHAIEKATNWDYSAGRYMVACEDGEIKA